MGGGHMLWWWPHGGGRPDGVCPVLSQLLLHMSYVFVVLLLLAVASRESCRSGHHRNPRIEGIKQLRCRGRDRFDGRCAGSDVDVLCVVCHAALCAVFPAPRVG